MGKWNNRERVMAALNGQEPDQVPYCELNIDRVFAAKLLGWDEKPYVNASDEETPFTLEEAKHFM